MQVEIIVVALFAVALIARRFLPGLLFEAVYHVEFRKSMQNKIAVFNLAIPGLLAAVGLTTLLLVPSVNGLAFVSDFTWATGSSSPPSSRQPIPSRSSLSSRA